MGSNDKMKKVELDFYDAAQDMLDGINLAQDKFDPLSRRLTNLMTTYGQSLLEASVVSPDEVKSHYANMAKEIPIQVGFFGTVIDENRKRHGLA